ncbi:MAG: hypothetical protein ACRDX8_13270 [Acidimicrobiales bacterium]
MSSVSQGNKLLHAGVKFSKLVPSFSSYSQIQEAAESQIDHRFSDATEVKKVEDEVFQSFRSDVA